MGSHVSSLDEGEGVGGGQRIDGGTLLHDSFLIPGGVCLVPTFFTTGRPATGLFPIAQS